MNNNTVKLIRLSALISICVIIISIALPIYSSLLPPQPSSLNKPLAEIIPAQISTWNSRDLPLADSQESSASIEAQLAYDDTLFREYNKKNLRFLVYISYWKPGKSSVNSVSMHTPDTCWVFSGWKRLERQYATQRQLDSRLLKSAEYGVYEKNEYKQNVLFWHLAGGIPFRYELTDSSLTLADKLKRNFVIPFKTIWDVGFGMSKEQFFIRISSEASIDTLWQDPGFKELLLSLKPLGVFQDKKSI